MLGTLERTALVCGRVGVVKEPALPLFCPFSFGSAPLVYLAIGPGGAVVDFIPGGIVIAEVLKDDFYSFNEVAGFLRLKSSTLKNRIYTGTEHPPYQHVGKEYLFPKSEFREWIITRPTVREVRRVS